MEEVVCLGALELLPEPIVVAIDVDEAKGGLDGVYDLPTNLVLMSHFQETELSLAAGLTEFVKCTKPTRKADHTV